MLYVRIVSVGVPGEEVLDVVMVEFDFLRDVQKRRVRSQRAYGHWGSHATSHYGAPAAKSDGVACGEHGEDGDRAAKNDVDEGELL